MYRSTVTAVVLLVANAAQNTNEAHSLATGNLNWAGMICTTTTTSIDPDTACLFPFKFKGRTYEGCTTDDDELGRAWCATSRDRHGQLEKGKWGYCSRPNSKACTRKPRSTTNDDRKNDITDKSDPRSDPNSDPRSIPRSDPRSVPRSDPRSDPRKDPRSNPNSDPRNSPTTHPTPYPTATTSNSGALVPAPVSVPTFCPTIGGPSGPGQSCVFPFIFAGVRYKGCTTDNDPEGKAWCVTEVDRDGQYVNGSGNWGYCTGNTKYKDACSGNSNNNGGSGKEQINNSNNPRNKNESNGSSDNRSHNGNGRGDKKLKRSPRPVPNNNPSSDDSSYNKFGWSADLDHNRNQAIRLFSAFPGLFRPTLPALVEAGGHGNTNGRITLLDFNADDAAEMAEWKSLLQSSASPETLAAALTTRSPRLMTPASVPSAFPLETNNDHFHDNDRARANGISLSGRFVVLLKDVDHYLKHPLETNPTVAASPQLSLFAKRMKFQQTEQRLRALAQSFAAQRFVRESEYRAARVAQVATNTAEQQQQQQQQHNPEWRLRFWGDMLTTLVRANLLICNLSPEAARWMATRPEVDAIVPGRHVEALGALVVRLVSKGVEEKEGNYEIERWTYAGYGGVDTNGGENGNNGSGDDDWWADDEREHKEGHLKQQKKGNHDHDQNGLMGMRVHSRRLQSGHARRLLRGGSRA